MSSSPLPSECRPVAKLELEIFSTDPPTRDDFFLFPNQILRFGRDQKSNDYAYACGSLSRNHLEFYSVIIDEEMEPMVYARDRQSANGTFVNDILIGRGDEVTPGRLLEDDDIVTIMPNLRFTVKLLRVKRTPLTDIQLLETMLFKDQYTLSDIVIGSGASTEVRLAHNVKTGQQLACKIYDLRERRANYMGEEIGELTRALDLMTQLNHPKILSLKRAYKSRHTLFVFEELAAGGDLYSLVCGSVRLTELDIQWILRQVLVGLEYLHVKGVAHRDIKLENVLLCVCPQAAHRIALTDFGHARLMTKGRALTSVGGTPGWQAPELFKGNRSHGLAVDMWSMGIMAVQLLLGSSESRMMAQVEATLPVHPYIKTLDFANIFSEIYEIRQVTASDGPREDFIRRCLECDQNKRMTASEALNHPYINGPASVRLQFEILEEETTRGWTTRPVRADLVQSLPDVLAPPAASARGNQKKPKLNLSLVDKKGIWKNERETTKSPYFGKVTKAVEIEYTRPDETGKEEGSRRKRKLTDDVTW